MTARETLIRGYTERHNMQILCMDKATYGDYLTVAKADRDYYLLMTDNLGKHILCIRHYSNWREAKRAYTALAYEP